MAAWPGSALGSQPELRGQGTWLRRQAALAAAGSAAGAALLLVTPAEIFGRVVPFLLAFAALALLLQPQISAWLAGRRVSTSRFLLPGGLVAVSAYDGYWGAGAGVMTLALLMITTGQGLTRSKRAQEHAARCRRRGLLRGFRPVLAYRLAAAALMAAGVLIGSMTGPSLTRHLPAHIVRVTTALAGLGLAIHLWAGSR